MYHQWANKTRSIDGHANLLYPWHTLVGSLPKTAAHARIHGLMSRTAIEAAAIRRALISILLVLLGTAIASWGGAHLSSPPIVIGGVALIVLGSRLLRPVSHGILRWLNDKDV